MKKLIFLIAILNIGFTHAVPEDRRSLTEERVQNKASKKVRSYAKNNNDNDNEKKVSNERVTRTPSQFLARPRDQR